MIRASLVTAGLLALLPASALPQSVSVAVQLTDPTGGSITGSFTTALGNLQDVRVVPTDHRPQYIIRGVVMCQPDTEDCGTATAYTMAIALVEPLSPTGLVEMAFKADSTHLIPSARAYRSQVWDLTEEYVKVHQLSTNTLGRVVYDRAIREFVTSLDAQCFEKSRILLRWDTALTEGLTEEAAALSEALRAGDWIC
jgi:hypothetical protein